MVPIKAFITTNMARFRRSQFYTLLNHSTKGLFRIPRQAPWWMKILLAGIYTLASLLLIMLLVDINFLWLFGDSPRISELKNPQMNIISELYSADGKRIGSYYIENRSPVEYNEISPNLVNALIATEDIRFYKHHGIDFRATFAVFWDMLHGQRRGGSTITQQLVKNLFKTRQHYSTGVLGKIPGSSTLISKVKEWVNAVKIELYYSKEDILTMYFNTVDFGSHAFGIKSAASTFFDSKPAQLTVAQSAVLVGLLKAPSFYSPVQNPVNSLNRRNNVLDQMAKYDFLDKATADSLSHLPLGLKIKASHYSTQGASYFRDAVARSLQKWCKDNDYDLYADGLKIYTTIDSRMQAYAEESLKEHLKRLQTRFDRGDAVVLPWLGPGNKAIPGYFEDLAKETPIYRRLQKHFGAGSDSISYYLHWRHKMRIFTWKGERDTVMSTLDSLKHYRLFLQSGFVSMDPRDGFVKAWVGGIDFDNFQFDHVSQSRRQPGSLFKAFVYAAAIDNGYGPCDEITDIPVSISYMEKGEKKTWAPHNVDWSHTGAPMTLKHAFAKSVNSIAVQVTEKIGWEKVIAYAHRLGVHSQLENVPSVCLGSSDVTLLEMVNAYSCFVNDGYLIDPVLVTRIEDKDGNLLYEYKPEKKQVLSYETAFLMGIMLRSGLTEPGGTTQGLWEYNLFHSNTEFGGKTGTSSNFADGWFIGVSPKLVSGAWVGNDDRSVHFRTSMAGEGLRTALPVVGKYLEKVMKDNTLSDWRGNFDKPKEKISKPYGCQTYLPKSDTLILLEDSLVPE
ncbi:MAG TPA: transglycosylase domain-containing protein [Bacteroidales bacterium]